MRRKGLFTALGLAAVVAFGINCGACAFNYNSPGTAQSQTADASELKETVGDLLNNIDFEKEIEEATNTVSDLEDIFNQISEEIVSAAEEYGEETGQEFVSARIVRVVDGDTIVVDIAGEETKVRLIGVNTPESVASQEYLDRTGTENTQEGKNASDFVKELLSNYENVYLQKDTSDTDRYGRALYYVWLEKPEDSRDIEEIRTKMLEGILLDKGYAEVKIYKPDVAYADEFAAIEAHITDEFENDR